MEGVSLAALREGKADAFGLSGLVSVFPETKFSFITSSEVGPSYNKENDESEQKVLIAARRLLAMFQVCSFDRQREHY